MTQAPRTRLAALAVCFTGTGAAGLLAEQAFEKLLGTLLGTSTPAGAAVLATYFGGLTLGAWLYARRWRRGQPLRTYAALEAVIAVACIVLALGCDRLVPLFAPLLRLGAVSAPGLLVARLVVAAVWILPVTVPMGATFPAIVDALDVLPERARRAAIPAFYGFNLAGAVAGAAFAPYLAFPRLGVDGVLTLAACLDGAAAAIAVASASALAVSRPGPERPVQQERATRAELPLLAVAGASGFLLFSLEVVWTHLVGTVLGNSVYAFGTMLAVVLVGLGIGAALAAVAGARLGRIPPYLPGAALAATALLIASTHGRWPEAPHEVALVGRVAETFADGEWARASVAARLLLAPTVVLGTVYPMLLRLDAFPRSSSGGTAARMAAVNAIGCIAGAVLVGFVVIPALGSDRTLRALAALAIVAGTALVVAYVRVRARAVALALALACFGALAILPAWDPLSITSGEHVYFRRTYVFPGTKLRFFHEDAAGGFTTVVENEVRKGTETARARYLLTNGKFQGDDSGEMAAQDGFALAPMQLVRRWDDALVIGLGTGRSAHTVRAMGFANVTIAEIAPGMIAAARGEFAHVNGRILERPNVRLAIEDGRNLLLLENRTYDLVTMEVSSIWFSNATNVYAREFYALAAARLRPGGVMQQWVQFHHVALEDLETMIATFRSVFPRVSLYVSGRQGVLVGTAGPQRIGAEYLDRLSTHVSDLGGGDAASRAATLAASRLLCPEDVDALVASRNPKINTDRNRHLEWQTPRYAFERLDRLEENIAALASFATVVPAPVEEDARGAAADAVRAVDPAAMRKVLHLR
jgi:spermidine synthase